MTDPMTDDCVQQAAEEASPRFRVLLGTHDGERYLREQLESLAAQSVGRIDLLVSDDGSTDGTRALLSRIASDWTRGDFEVVEGPCAGFAENYRYLIRCAEVDAEFYAFCDQDDVWDADKLARAAVAISTYPSSQPVLYCGATRIVSEDGEPIGNSPIMTKPPSFRNALVQSIAGGNTMMLNRRAFALLQKACNDIKFVSHDWWAYLVISGAGGTVIYDPIPSVSYRQHGRNIVGANLTVAARMRRVHGLLHNRFRMWHDTNLSSLTLKRDLLAPENVRLLDGFVASRRQRIGFAAAVEQRRLGLYRQSWQGNFMLFLGGVLGKV